MTKQPLTPKPPLGILPHKLWLEIRMKSLHAAIGRYLEVDNYSDFICKWIQELDELVQVYNKKFPKK